MSLPRIFWRLCNFFVGFVFLLLDSIPPGATGYTISYISTQAQRKALRLFKQLDCTDPTRMSPTMIAEALISDDVIDDDRDKDDETGSESALSRRGAADE